MNAKASIAFLKEAAAYFSKQPTDGEDSKHWANVLNSENCIHAAEAIALQASRIAELESALRGILSAETHDLHVGYDSGSGGGNYVYADVVRTDDEAFIVARKILGEAP